MQSWKDGITNAYIHCDWIANPAERGFLNYASGEGMFLERLFKHTFSQGFLEGVQGGNALHGMMMGAVSGAGGHLIDRYANSLGKGGEIAASAVLGGTVDELGGGKFANGAITSAFSTMFNDMIHSNIQRLKEKIESDGKLTFSEARKWYRHGDGSTITVDVNSLNLDFLVLDYDLTAMKIGYSFSFSTLNGGKEQFLVYGSVTAKFCGDNSIKLYNDRYDFEPHHHSGEHIRNIETWIGSKVHGRGTPFDIRFKGVYHLPNRSEMLLRRIHNMKLNAL